MEEDFGRNDGCNPDRNNQLSNLNAKKKVIFVVVFTFNELLVPFFSLSVSALTPRVIFVHPNATV